MFAGNEESYGHGTLIDVRGDLSVDYSVLYLASLALLGIALWGDVFPIHVTCCEIWTFGVCLLGMRRAMATEL